jgi:hypothetical protein
VQDVDAFGRCADGAYLTKTGVNALMPHEDGRERPCASRRRAQTPLCPTKTGVNALCLTKTGVNGLLPT